MYKVNTIILKSLLSKQHPLSDFISAGVRQVLGLDNSLSSPNLTMINFLKDLNVISENEPDKKLKPLNS